MNKNYLRTRYGHICDTDKLVDDMRNLLTKYHHANSEYGVCEMLAAFFDNKAFLISLLEKSDHYIGDLRACTDIELSSNITSANVNSCLDRLYDEVNPSDAILSKYDENGKILSDYVATMPKKLKARDLHYGDTMMQINSYIALMKSFADDGYSMSSKRRLDVFNNAVGHFYYYAQSVLTEGRVRDLRSTIPEINFAAGMKTSRAFNRLCHQFGVDKLPNYNREFAKYADVVSANKRKLKLYISVNPLDYLTMSFGNSWSSCHTIDKKNERRMENGYRGMHAGGCVSYMLDATSIITYAHNVETTDHEKGKIYRNMFHYDGGLLLQGRVYPQGNDGATDLYQEFRFAMQAEMAQMLGVSNTWVRKTENGTINTNGCHYPDYIHFSGCNVSYPKEFAELLPSEINVGSARICPDCGNVIDEEYDGGALSCCCAHEETA